MSTLYKVRKEIENEVELLGNHILSGTCTFEEYLKKSGELAGLHTALNYVTDQIRKQERDE